MAVGLWVLGAIGFLAWFVVPARAVDPLPVLLRDQSEEVQRAYVAREAKQSRREQLAAGLQRYETRMAIKQALSEFVKSVAETNRKEVEASMQSREGLPIFGSNSVSAGRSFWPSVIGLMFLAALAWQWVRWEARER